MLVILHNTTRIVEINGTPARVWEGTTETGIACYALVARIVCHVNDAEPFAKEMDVETLPSPRAVQAFPPRIIQPT